MDRGHIGPAPTEPILLYPLRPKTKSFVLYVFVFILDSFFKDGGVDTDTRPPAHTTRHYRPPAHTRGGMNQTCET